MDIRLRADGEDEKDDGCGVKARGGKWVNVSGIGVVRPNSETFIGELIALLKGIEMFKSFPSKIQNESVEVSERNLSELFTPF